MWGWQAWTLYFTAYSSILLASWTLTGTLCSASTILGICAVARFTFKKEIQMTCSLLSWTKAKSGQCTRFSMGFLDTDGPIFFHQGGGLFNCSRGKGLMAAPVMSWVVLARFVAWLSEARFSEEDDTALGHLNAQITQDHACLSPIREQGKTLKSFGPLLNRIESLSDTPHVQWDAIDANGYLEGIDSSVMGKI